MHSCCRLIGFFCASVVSMADLLSVFFHYANREYVADTFGQEIMKTDHGVCLPAIVKDSLFSPGTHKEVIQINN